MGRPSGKTRIAPKTVAAYASAPAKPKARRTARLTKFPGRSRSADKPQKNGYWNGFAPDGVTRLICRHCGVNKANRPRQMCWTCYYAPGVKELYVSQCVYTRKGLGLQAGGLPLDTLICPYLPGTPGKIEFMADRAERGVQVFHPKDAKYGGGTMPDVAQIAMVVVEEAEAADGSGSFSGRWAA